MSASITPLYNMNVVAGEALMNQIASQLKTMQQTKAANTKKYSDWQSVITEPAKPASQGNEFLATTLISVLLDGLFGMGLFSGMSDAVQGVAHISAMEHTTRGNNPQMQRTAQINEALNQRNISGAQTAQKNQMQQMKMLQQMMAMLLMNMVSQQSEEGEEAAGGSTGQSTRHQDVVNDDYRQIDIARFKQNKHSMHDIRASFARQVKMVTPKQTAPRYAFN